MKKILLFVIGMLYFVGGVKADVYPYVDFWFSKKIISVDEEVIYKFNDFNNNSGNYTIKYDEEYLEYIDYWCNVGDYPYEISEECATKCEVDTQKSGELTFTCDNQLSSEELLSASFKTIKATDGEETIIYETFDEHFTSLSFEIVDTNKIDNNVSNGNNINSLEKCDCGETPNIELLTNPFVIGIISGFSIVVVILSVMLSKKNKQIKNVQN